MISMNTALLVSLCETCIQLTKEADGDHTSIQLVLTNDVSPRDSQDDKILPEHPKFNPKFKLFYSNPINKREIKCMKSLDDPFSLEERNCKCV